MYRLRGNKQLLSNNLYSLPCKLELVLLLPPETVATTTWYISSQPSPCFLAFLLALPLCEQEMLTRSLWATGTRPSSPRCWRKADGLLRAVFSGSLSTELQVLQDRGVSLPAPSQPPACLLRGGQPRRPGRATTATDTRRGLARVRNPCDGKRLPLEVAQTVLMYVCS